MLDFLSNMYTLNAILTLNFNLFADAARHLILPAIALGTIPMAIIARMTRSSLLEVLGPGLRAHGTRKGHDAAHRAVAARPAQRPAAGRNGHRPVGRRVAVAVPC